MEGESLKVKVRMDVEEPLKKGTNVKIRSMAELKWIPVTYKKLPNFCYCCGKLGYTVQECENEKA